MSKAFLIGGANSGYDPRLPVGLGSVGQVPKVNSTEDGMEWGAAGGGGSLFRHDICFNYKVSLASHYYQYMYAKDLTIYNDIVTPMTVSELGKFLYDIGFTTWNNSYICYIPNRIITWSNSEWGICSLGLRGNLVSTGNYNIDYEYSIKMVWNGTSWSYTSTNSAYDITFVDRVSQTT